MLQVRERELAQAEKPVGMAGPFHVEIVAEIEGQRDAAALQLVDDGAVVDAADGRESAVAIVKQPVAFFSNMRDVDGANAEPAFRHQEIVPGFLIEGVNLEQDHVFRLTTPRDQKSTRLNSSHVASSYA